MILSKCHIRLAAATLALLPTAPAFAAGHVVTMANMSFGKMPADLKVGDTITWVNRDTVPHTATARDHSFNVRTAPGQSVTMTLSKAGTVAFSCIYHSMMRGTMTVAAK